VEAKKMVNVGRVKRTRNSELRKKTIRITEAAAFYLTALKEKRENFDLSRYVSECIIRDFGNNEIGYLKYLIMEDQKIIDAHYRKVNDNAERIAKLREIKENEIYSSVIEGKSKYLD